MSNGDSESEEEILVYAEFEDSVNIDKYRAIHILGAENKNPIIQLDETFFMGKYENALGTYMFFEKDSAAHGTDPLFDKYPDTCLRYVCKTRKLISMEHAYVTPKDANDANTQNLVTQTDDDIQPVSFQDAQQATEAFKAYFISDPSQNKSTDHEITGASTESEITHNSEQFTEDPSSDTNLIEIEIEPTL